MSPQKIKTRIVLSNNLDLNEKLKSISAFGGSSFAVRYLNTLELADYLMTLNGIYHGKKMIPNDVLAAKIYLEIKSVDYFSLYTYDDTLKLINSLQELRLNILDHEKETIAKLKDPQNNPCFIKKNEAVVEAYRILMNTLNKEDALDEIGVIRFALANTKQFNDIEFDRFYGAYLKPLELALLEKASGKKFDNDMKVVLEKEENQIVNPLHVERYTKAFGQVNEIEDIIDYIYKEHIPMNQCLIASAEGTNYANILANYRDMIGFPVVIGLGKKLIDTKPGKLFSLLLDWMNNYYRYEFLLRIINDECFNREQFETDLGVDQTILDEINKNLDYRYQLNVESIVETAGRLKVSIDDGWEKVETKNYVIKNNAKFKAYHDLIKRYEQEQYDTDQTESRIAALPYVAKVIDIINKGLLNFILTYSKLDNASPSDINALGKIEKAFSFRFNGIPFEQIQSQIFGQSVGREKPQFGSLYFTTINRASSCLRKHLFIVGMSSKLFPGNSVEDPIILDNDFELLFGKGSSKPSDKTIENNRIDYFSLLLEARKYGSEIHISWPSYNSETLKPQNASSVVFETFEKECGPNVSIDISSFNKKFDPENEDLTDDDKKKYRYIEYFNSNLLPVNPIGRNVTNNVNVDYQTIPQQNSNRKVALEKLKRKMNKGGFSATAIKDFVECQYLFFLKQGLGVQQPEDIDIFEVIPANDFGTLAHDVLEHVDDKITEAEFMDVASQRFDEYMIINPLDNDTLVSFSKKEFLDMMKIAFEMEEKEKTAFKEDDIRCLHQASNVVIHGFPDKVIQLSNGNYKIIDYKTGRSVKHEMDKVEWTIQCTMYAYITEQVKKVKVDSFEYRYIRIGESVSSEDMTKHYSDLEGVLKNLHKSVTDGTFEPNLSHCKECYHSPVCPIYLRKMREED